MKRLFAYISALMVLASCSLDDVVFQGNEAGPSVVLQLDCSGLTKAKVAGEDQWNENYLDHIDVFFYPDGSDAPAVYQEGVAVGTDGKAVIYVSDDEIDAMFPSGNVCAVYVIANRPDGVSLPEDKTVASLKGLKIQAPGFRTQKKQDSFVMDGQSTATLTESVGVKSVSGNVPLFRAASKITLSVNNPSSINITDEDGNVVETWIPNPAQMEVRFNNGVSAANVDVSEVPYTVLAEDYFNTKDYARGFTASSDASSYACEAPFYSYSSQWSKTDDTNAYFTLVLPWSKDGGRSYQNCYYQVLINAEGRAFERNWWYNMVLNVGVLGSFVEDKPTEISAHNYYIPTWGSEAENVTLRDWVYLIVPQTYKEIDNKVSDVLVYESSHDISITVNSVTYQTFASANPTTVTVTDYSDYEFTTEEVNGVKYIRFTHIFSDKIFSPIVIKATVTMTAGSLTFSEPIEIVQYPPIWVKPYQNSEYTTGDDTVFVNGYNADEDGTGKTYTTDRKYWLGSLNDKNDSETPNMYVITVSSLHSNNTFSYNGQSGHEYIIGDPRVTSPDNLLTTGWLSAPSLYQGESRPLTWYYPTDSSDDVYNVIAPKFRIVSAYSSSGQNSVNSVTAELRCAAYQEDGYPAGRWRLPTYAEVQFAVYLQSQGFIPNIFKTQTKYYFSTGDLTSISTDPTITNGSSTTEQGSVRCVYDDWYWGSERACDENTFTWGDQPR